MNQFKNVAHKVSTIANQNPQAFRMALSLAITIIAAALMGSPADAVKLAGPNGGATGGI